MKKPCVLAVIESLYFRSQLEGIARSKDVELYFASQGEQLSQLVKTFAPLMMIVDLSGLNSDWIFRHISNIIENNPRFPIVAFISHVREDVRQRAEKYGCRFILTKSQLAKKLPETIEQILRGL